MRMQTTIGRNLAAIESDQATSESEGGNGEPRCQDLKPVRYWAFPIAALLFLYGGFQLVALPRRLDMGIPVVGIQIAVTAIAFIGAFAMFKFAVPRN